MHETILTGASPTLMSVGSIVLDAQSRTLTGPSGTVDLSRGVNALLALLMRRPGVTVPLSAVIELLWNNPDEEPGAPEHAVRMRVRRARAALRTVGATDATIRSVFMVGYSMAGPRTVVRALSVADAAKVDAYLARERAAPAEQVAA